MKKLILDYNDVQDIMNEATGNVIISEAFLKLYDDLTSKKYEFEVLLNGELYGTIIKKDDGDLAIEIK